MDERDLFAVASEIPNSAERAAWLDEACGNDLALRDRLNELLAHHDPSASFLSLPPSECLSCDTQLRDSDTDKLHRLDSICGLFLAPSDTPESLGRLGKYEVLKVLGRGGMGFVFLGQDRSLQRQVALKMLAPEHVGDVTAERRFVREAHAVAALAHPNIVAIHAIHDATVPYMVMELIDGESLADRISRKGALTTLEVVEVAIQISTGLAAAHASGLIHRDIKPSNILFESTTERVKITDFGLARAADDATLTRSGEIAGTPQYMSPEQAQGKDLDHRTDLFSLGSTMYAMCTGRPPFHGPHAVSVLRQLCDQPHVPVRSHKPMISEWLADFIDRLMEKQPEQRFQTAAEVKDQLEQYRQYLRQPTLLNPPDFQRVRQDGQAPKPLSFVRREPFTTSKSTHTQESSARPQAGARISIFRGGVLAAVMIVTACLSVTGFRAKLGTESNMMLETGSVRQTNTTVPVIAAVDADQAKSRQEDWADSLSVPLELKVTLPGDVELALVLIPPGEFMMGSSQAEQGKLLEEAALANDRRSIDRIPFEGPRHRVHVTEAFYLGKFEVTQAQWQALMGDNPSTSQNHPDYPVEQVSWNDIQSFLTNLNARNLAPGIKFVLPTEAQWEYACRAGTTTTWYGTDHDHDLLRYAWVKTNSAGQTHSVGQLEPNAFGLYDMHGNVWEWCRDAWEPGFYTLSSVDDPEVVSGGSARVHRGGGMNNHARRGRSASRFGHPAETRDNDLGFRIAAIFSTD